MHASTTNLTAAGLGLIPTEDKVALMFASSLNLFGYLKVLILLISFPPRASNNTAATCFIKINFLDI